jgi:hypothetical protein
LSVSLVGFLGQQALALAGAYAGEGGFRDL